MCFTQPAGGRVVLRSSIYGAEDSGAQRGATYEVRCVQCGVNISNTLVGQLLELERMGLSVRHGGPGGGKMCRRFLNPCPPEF